MTGKIFLTLAGAASLAMLTAAPLMAQGISQSGSSVHSGGASGGKQPVPTRRGGQPPVGAPAQSGGGGVSTYPSNQPFTNPSEQGVPPAVSTTNPRQGGGVQ